MMAETSTLAPVAWATESVQVCGLPLHYQRAGSGPPLLVIPRDNGHAPRNECLDRLTESFTVYHPWLPGFHGGDPADWTWLTNARDVAIVLRQFMRELGHERLAIAGFGFGGWLAAEMATMSGDRLSALVLVAPMGIQPKDAYIYDQFIASTEMYARHGFSDPARFDAIYGHEPDFDQLEGWESDREMTSRVAWKPYMFNAALPGLLGGVAAPTLIIWGDDDQVVPAECGERYRDAIPGARLETIAGAGHAVDHEQPGALARAITSFVQSA